MTKLQNDASKGMSEMAAESPDDSPSPLGELEKQSVCEGAPVALSREWGDKWRYANLGSGVSFPGRHVPPAVQSAARNVVAAEANRHELEDEIAARGPAREQLKRELIEDGRTAGPARSQAAKILSEFDAETELMQELVPGADDNIRAAWDRLDAALGDVRAEWDEYLRVHGLNAAQRLAEAVELTLAEAGECRLIDQLLARDGIGPERTAETGAAWHVTNDRVQRSISIDRMMASEDHPSEGHRYGLAELPGVYTELFTPPQPQAVAQPEVEPETETEAYMRIHQVPADQVAIG